MMYVGHQGESKVLATRQGMHWLMMDEGEGDDVVMTLAFDDGNWIGGGVMPPMMVAACLEHDLLVL